MGNKSQCTGVAMVSETNAGRFWEERPGALHNFRGSGRSPGSSDVFHKFNMEFVTKIDIKTAILTTFSPDY